MDIFDIFDEPDSIIDPTSSYADMQDKIESNKEDFINDFANEVESVVPEQDFNDLVTDILNDFDDSSKNGDKNDN